eukprot:933434-Pelagomonas_calceolata.AAC.11
MSNTAPPAPSHHHYLAAVAAAAAVAEAVLVAADLQGSDLVLLLEAVGWGAVGTGLLGLEAGLEEHPERVGLAHQVAGAVVQEDEPQDRETRHAVLGTHRQREAQARAWRQVCQQVPVEGMDDTEDVNE